MLEILRNPSRPLKIFYLAMTAFIAVWAGTIAGQVPEDNSKLGLATLWLTYGLLPLLILPFAVELKSVKVHVVLCLAASFLIILGYMLGFNSVNETEPRTWYEPLIMLGFTVVMVVPMLVFSAVYYGAVKLVEHFRLVPTFLRT